jgi:PAS domain S-box-containing protein
MAARVEEAVAAGFAGVHAAIAKTWLASEGFGASWEREYELVAISRLHLLALSILCLFNPRGLPPDMLLDIYRLHPWIAIEGAVQPNLFYEPPEHLLDPPSAQARADWMHDQLLRLHESNQALRRHAGEFRALVETAPDSILHFDHDLRLIYVNPAGERLRGRPASQLIGKTTQEAGLAAAQVPGWDLALRQVFRTGRELMVEVPGRLPSGEEGRYQARLTPMLGADGTVTSVISIARDVSDRTRADHERERLYQELMEREGRLREMVEQILLHQTADRRRVEGSLELQQLTSRELEILHFLAKGRTNQQIGLEMGLASGTVRNHVSRLLAKLGAVSRTQAAILAVEWGLST